MGDVNSSWKPVDGVSAVDHQQFSDWAKVSGAPLSLWGIRDVEIEESTNQPPVISTAAAQAVAEGVLAVVTIEATDPDGDILTYSISGTDAASFSISSAGVLTFNTAPDFETKSSYSITVSVNDATTSATLATTVVVTNVDEPPFISTAAAQAIVEGLFNVVTIEATDPDGNTLTYSISGTDAASFSISSAGVLTFNTAPDFETKSSYSITVSVDDATTSANLAMTVTVIDQSADMSISSAAFKNTGSTHFNLPLGNTCYGANGGVSPLLSWSGASDSSTHYAVTMHSVSRDGTEVPHFTLFNIPSSVTTLPAGDFSVGTVATGDMTAAEIIAAGDVAYAAPCATGAGTETFYYFTVYSLSRELNLSTTTSQAQVKAAINDDLLGSASLTTKRISFDEASIANNDHVPKSVASTCEAKTEHFNEYSNMYDSISCDTAANEIIVMSKFDSGLKTALANQQVGTGTTSWIGRLALPSTAGASLRIAPDYLSGVNNNFECTGAGGIGISIDGQPMFPYYKQGGSATGFSCGPNDGISYADRDTVLTGEVDQCYGHSPNGEGYHLHGAPICLMDVHNPSKPVAYMTDGIPLYFGQAGGALNTTDLATTVSYATPTNYGAGQYDHLDYRPADVKDGSNPLNACNAYDINGDGAISGYAYYSTKEAPYAIGCYQGNVLDSQTRVGGGTKLATTRQGWTGQTLGEAMDVEISSNVYGTFNSKTYNITEFAIRTGGTTPAFLTEGKTAQVLWRILDDSDTEFDATTTCFEFRYRKDKEDTTADETETHCAERSLSATTLAFTPYGD